MSGALDGSSTRSLQKYAFGCIEFIADCRRTTYTEKMLLGSP